MSYGDKRKLILSREHREGHNRKVLNEKLTPEPRSERKRRASREQQGSDFSSIPHTEGEGKGITVPCYKEGLPTVFTV